MRRERLVLLADVLVVAWVVAWIAVGVRIDNEVEGLRDLGASVAQTGAAVERTGAALGSIDLPLVGDELDEIASGIVETGRRTQDGARQAQQSASDLSTLLGVAIAVIPASALLIPYVPLRVARIRERSALRRLDERHGDDPHFDRLLADRALRNMSYRRLGDLPGRPWDEEAVEDRQELAEAERSRLGLRTER